MRPFIVRTTTGRIDPQNLGTALWPTPHMSRMLMYSVVFHLCLVTSFMIVKALNLSLKKLPIIYTVDLVEFARPGGGPTKQVSAPPVSTPRVSKVVEKKAEEPKPSKETKKSPPKPKDEKQVTLASRKKVETPKNDKVTKPKEKPAETTMPAEPPKKEEPPEPELVASNNSEDFVTSGDPGDIMGPGNLSKDLINPELRWYIEIIRRKVWQNWIEPRHVLSDGVHARVVIRFEIGRDGNFASPPEVFESSNISLVDQSGYRAVVRSAPFPPLPESYTGNTMGIRFGFEYGEKA